MSDFAIRNWAFFIAVLIGLFLYGLGRIDQRRRDLVTITRLRATIKECDQLLMELKQVANG